MNNEKDLNYPLYFIKSIHNKNKQYKHYIVIIIYIHNNKYL